jgi:release factor glutamine methyltransferase
MPPVSSDVWTVRRLLDWTLGYLTRRGVDSPRLASEMLLSHVLKLKRLQLYLDHDRTLLPEELSQYRDLVRRAGEHEPVQYLVGRAFFFGLELEVTPSVLIPRPDSETIIEDVLQQARTRPELKRANILDLCTGSGCLALALAQNLPESKVVATDLSEDALAIARRNAAKHKLHDRVTFHQGDLYAALPPDAGPFDLLVSNPPYIPTNQYEALDRNVKEYEPRAALDAGPDGLAFHRRILAGADEHLTPTALIRLEIAHDQADEAKALAPAARILYDLERRPRVLALDRG